VEITWLGHSCFRIKGKEATVVTDPYDESLGYPPRKLSANVVTVSHPHPGHSNLREVEGNPRVLRGPGEYEIADILIIGIPTYHDSEQGRKRGKNTAYLIEVDELTVCHLGDLGHQLSPQQVEQLGSVQVLLVPVGGVSTIDAHLAAEMVRLLSPRIVIPMHYRTEATSWLQPIEEFLRQMGVRETVPQPRLSVTRSNLPAEAEVVVLNYR
jgi:L-ascorbate metabolism protein UlaG (beta-lactamase superfamily)